MCITDRLSKSLLEKRSVIIFRDGDVFTSNLTKSGKDRIGYIEEIETFVDFLNKFGRRLFIDDFIDRLFGDECKRWEINSRLFLTGYKLSLENPRLFRELTEKAENGKDFFQMSGII